MPSWCIPFPILNQSFVPCLVLTAASWPVYTFLRRQVRWSGIPISKNFLQFVVVHIVKSFSIVTEADVYVFLELRCFLNDPTNISNLISGFSVFSKPSLYLWKFSVHILLKSSLKHFEHNLASILNEHNCTLCSIVGTLFGIALPWDWNENWHFSVPCPLLSFPNLLMYWVQHFNSIVF